MTCPTPPEVEPVERAAIEKLRDEVRNKHRYAYNHRKESRYWEGEMDVLDAVLIRLDTILSPAPNESGERCETCHDKGEYATGECREAMSGPTCMNPKCPPCQTPEMTRCPDCESGEKRVAEGERAAIWREILILDKAWKERDGNTRAYALMALEELLGPPSSDCEGDGGDDG